MKPFHYLEERSKFPTHTKVFGDIRITITYDEWADAPYEDYDMAGFHFFWSDGRNDSWVRGHCDKDDRFTYNDKLANLAARFVSPKKIIAEFKKPDGCNGARLRYNRSERCWYMQYKSYSKQEWLDDYSIDNLYDDASWLFDLADDDTLETLLSQVNNIAFDTARLIGYCQGDVTYIISVMTLAQYKERVEDTPRRHWRDHAIEMMKQEQEEIRCWVYGEVWQGAIEKRIPNDPDDPDDDHSDDDNDDNWQIIDDDIHRGPYYCEDEDQVFEWIALDAGYEINK